MVITTSDMKDRLWDDATEVIGTDDMPKVLALAHHLESIDFEDVEGYIDNDYLVYTVEEAVEAVREYIEETVWAFSPTFLEAHITGVDSEAIQAVQDKLSEGANDVLKSMLNDLDDFVDDAVACDGRGHFLSTYDGEEIQIQVDRTVYYIYRIG
jgi:hypothetical protein|tara:strand:+ start:482 stop:943 length:462 start_codon:yes stop_codon:yes gene_type:complete